MVNRIAAAEGRGQQRGPCLDALGLTPSETLRPRDRFFWDHIMRGARPRTETGRKAAMSADLARVLADIEALSAEAEANADDDAPIPLATERRLASLTGRALDLGRMLGLHGDDG